jgi:hypothetical protein
MADMFVCVPCKKTCLIRSWNKLACSPTCIKSLELLLEQSSEMEQVPFTSAIGDNGAWDKLGGTTLHLCKSNLVEFFSSKYHL